MLLIHLTIQCTGYITRLKLCVLGTSDENWGSSERSCKNCWREMFPFVFSMQLHTVWHSEQLLQPQLSRPLSIQRSLWLDDSFNQYNPCPHQLHTLWGTCTCTVDVHVSIEAALCWGLPFVWHFRDSFMYMYITVHIFSCGCANVMSFDFRDGHNTHAHEL